MQQSSFSKSMKQITHSLPIFSPFIPLLRLLLVIPNLKIEVIISLILIVSILIILQAILDIQEGVIIAVNMHLLSIAEGIRNDYILFGHMVKKAKVIFLGDTAVGKSCLISALNGHPISSTHQPTIGMDFSTKVCYGSKDEYKLQLWDTAGQQKFRSIMPSYIRNSKIVVLVYDVTCAKTFGNLQKWIEMFHESAGQTSQLIVVGNKIDLYHDRRVCMQKVQQKIRANKLKYLEISAKSGEGVKELFDQIIAELDKMVIPNQTGNDSNQLRQENVNKAKCCGKS